MAIYQYITNRFTLPVIEIHLAQGREQGREEGREEGIEEGRAEGREQGIEEGRAEANQKWQAWNQRRMDAAANDLPFDEPPPGLQ